MVKLDRCFGSCNIINDLSNKVCVPNKTEDLNLHVFMDVRCNSNAHRSVHLLIVVISSYRHIKWKQLQRIFFHYSCFVIMIKIVKKCL